MRVALAVVGRLKDGPERQLYDRYTQRFDAAGKGLALGPLTLAEIPEGRAGDAPSRQADESRRLLAHVADATVRVVLDERGKTSTSADFARQLGRWRDDGVARLAFLIGGPDGHGAATFEAATAKLSLGPMTLPHGLARIVLVEQLYRAATILSGHPYHRA